MISYILFFDLCHKEVLVKVFLAELVRHQVRDGWLDRGRLPIYRGLVHLLVALSFGKSNPWGRESHIIVLFPELSHLLRDDDRILEAKDVQLGEIEFGLLLFAALMSLPCERTIKAGLSRLPLIRAVVVSDRRLSIGKTFGRQMNTASVLLVDGWQHVLVIRPHKNRCQRLSLGRVVHLSALVSVISVALCQHIYNYII